MKTWSVLPLILAAFLMAATPSRAEVPKKINYQGYLTNPAGSPLTGTYTMVFSLCTAATGGTCPWSESQSVAVDKGIFNVTLGSITTLNLTFDIPYFLDIQVGGESMSARQPLTSVGYAFMANTVSGDGANLASLNADNLASGTVPAARLGTVAIANGGTGATSAANALNNLLPSQVGNGGKVLSTDGSGTVSWISAGGGADSTSPVAIAGSLAATNSGLDIALTWTAATDNVTPQSNLEYTVFYSLSNNIGTVANAEANGIVAGLPWSSNITSRTVTGLTIGTTYYFNVAVKDAGLNKAVYTTVSKVPAVPTTNVILYGSGTTSAGNMGGRSGANALCTANKPAGYTNYAAFLSVSGSDSISGRQAFSGLDTSRNIRSTNGTLIANNWSDLLDGTIITSLTSAGVSLPTGYWWSGSNADGTVGLTCSGWTSSVNPASGSDPSGDWGTNGNTNSLWIYPGAIDRTYCADPSDVLCIAW